MRKRIRGSFRKYIDGFRAKDVDKMLKINERGGSLMMISAYLDYLAEQGLLEVHRSRSRKKYITKREPTMAWA